MQTCKIFGCSESLMRWVDKYKSTNNITRKKRDYTAYKIGKKCIRRNIYKNLIKGAYDRSKKYAEEKILIG